MSGGYYFSYTLTQAPCSFFSLSSVRPAGSGLPALPEGLSLWFAGMPSLGGKPKCSSYPARVQTLFTCSPGNARSCLTPHAYEECLNPNLLHSFPKNFFGKKKKIHFYTLRLPFFSICLLNPVTSRDLFRVCMDRAGMST